MPYRRKTIAFILLTLLLVLTGPAGNLPNVVQAAPLASLPSGDSFGYVPSPASPVTLPEDVCSTGTVIFEGVDSESFSSFLDPTGFSFPFYETTATNLRVSVNGLITVTDPNTDVPEHSRLPSDVLPNGLIAPYWTNLNLATGKVCYRSFPEYLAVEWNNVETTNGIPLTFQALLYPNGNIMFQYSDPLPSATDTSIGIEDADGIFGMQLHSDETGSLPDQAILISYPTDSHAGARFIPPYSSGFLIQHVATLQITLQNIMAVDSAFRLDVNDSTPETCSWALPAEWTMTIYDGDAPLSINNGCPETAILASGEKKVLTARITSPEALDVGDYEQFSLTAFPADPAVLPSGFTPLLVSMNLQVAVPANFAQAYKDPSQAINLNRTWKDQTATTQAGNLLYYGANLAMVRTTGGNYFIVWEYKTGYSRLKGSFLGPNGQNLVSDFLITTQTTMNDEYPSLVALPDGSTSVVWIRGTTKLYLRSYSSNGAARINETPLKVSTCPRLSSPQVTALSSSKLLVVWECDRASTDIYLNIVSIANDQVSDQVVQLTQSGTAYEYYNPQILALDNGTAMVSYIRKQKTTGKIDPFVYQVVNDSGATIQAEPTPPASAAIPAQKIERDLDLLRPGTVLAGWTNGTTGTVQYTTLRGSYNNWAQDPVANLPIDFQIGAEKLSITHDSDGNGILTWLEAKKNSTLNYALVGPDDAGVCQLLTPAMIFFNGPNSVTLDTSATGQGNTSYDPFSSIYIPLVMR
ncbi:hypothetical protein LARV_03441 [Longilinea arvoryzae]|uniref:Uncharacterized protein n=1 Tax=Longilinea arvoryzae TaxID=360412 RepID=A0A0S7BNU7_9CHLR|nr:hypothetical protein [Longilinea arvoryzae]GAP15649.1 hypothetical protein LARV_03441 [Longilinea arvoryzae]